MGLQHMWQACLYRNYSHILIHSFPISFWIETSQIFSVYVEFLFLTRKIMIQNSIISLNPKQHLNVLF